MDKYMKDAVYAVACGDALGCPVQFKSRSEIAKNPVTGMRGYGTFNLPPGSWTDDTSLTLAALASIRKNNAVDPVDIMKNFCAWLRDGAFTPFGYAYDIGFGCMSAIEAFMRGTNIHHAARTDERNNGNGSLMRISPVCVWCAINDMSDEEAIHLTDEVSGLTHGHPRAKTACGLYYFMIHALIHEDGTLSERLQKGMDRGIAFYEAKQEKELETYHRLFSLAEFAKTDEADIRSSGYVLDALEAAVWCLITEDSLEASLLKAVNLGEDTDTTAAIAGGLAGVYYGMDAIPADWLNALQKKEIIDHLLA